MKQKKTLILITLFFIASLFLAACGNQPAAATKSEPAEVEPMGDTGLNQITLTERANERLDIQVADVQQAEMNGSEMLVVSTAALIYDLQGNTWVYIKSAPLTYHREPVMVDHIDGEMVYLKEGLSMDTEVVTVGVAELYGIDTGVGK